MNDLKEIIEKYHFTVKGYRSFKNVHYLDTANGEYILKKKTRDDLKDIYNYLKNKQFFYFIESKDDERDNYEILPYVKDNSFSSDKAVEIVYLMALLHNKTTFYKQINLSETKEFYEDYTDKINEMRNYYDNLYFVMFSDVYNSPSNYILLRNISAIYNSLDLCKMYLDKWYSQMENKTNKRVALNHNNLDMSHIITGENNYLISWNKAKIDVPINDLYIFFKNNSKILDIDSLFKIYISKYSLFKEELYYFFVLLLFPKRIEFIEGEMVNVKNTYNDIVHIVKVLEFVLKNDLEKKEQ